MRLLRTSSLILPLLIVAGGSLLAQFTPSASVAPLVNRSVDLGEHLATGHTGVDKCGTPTVADQAWYMSLVAAGEGYFYEDLVGDLWDWRENWYVTEVTSIGKTVQDRDIWELTITSRNPGVENRHRVTIHARTHPHEIQSWWVVEEIIKFLTSEHPYAEHLRRHCVFHIYPMYNPDGVELRSTRYNANGVDLERQWDKENPEPEAAALKARFGTFMNSSQPIKVALNLHSSSDPERYFWFHAEGGTSREFADLERRFISGVRAWFGRIMPWDYAVSWTNAPATHFPESWFWFNYGTDVMALTYEDVFSHTLETADADFDSAAFALLRGVGEYLEIGEASAPEEYSPSVSLLSSPVLENSGRLAFRSDVDGVIALDLYDQLGRTVAREQATPVAIGRGSLQLASERLSSGTYFLRVTMGGSEQILPVVLY